ncbi:energy transducer TonB [Nibribacter koreensis]|uniref:TonB C-terminal domain-containing protein n=1 Tax=Nibribacter koreensis TaxID=1084519 RepID=A0ABP8FYJ8_9BACT
MRFLAFLFLLLFSLSASAQEVRFYSKNFQANVPSKTGQERRYVVEGEKLRAEDYQAGTLIQKSTVSGTINFTEADAYLLYLKNETPNLIKPYFSKLKGTVQTYSEAGAPSSEIYARAEKIKYGQVWGSENQPFLVKGAGRDTYWNADKSEQNITVYKDSMLVASYIYRLGQKDTLYTKLDKAATPKNGLEMFRFQLSSACPYPSKEVMVGSQTTIYIQFTINEKGELKDFTPLDKPGYTFDEATKAKLEASPAWTPATFRGRAVKSRQSVPITFKQAK